MIPCSELVNRISSLAAFYTAMHCHAIDYSNSAPSIIPPLVKEHRSIPPGAALQGTKKNVSTTDGTLNGFE